MPVWIWYQLQVCSNCHVGYAYPVSMPRRAVVYSSSTVINFLIYLRLSEIKYCNVTYCNLFSPLKDLLKNGIFLSQNLNWPSLIFFTDKHYAYLMCTGPAKVAEPRAAPAHQGDGRQDGPGRLHLALFHGQADCRQEQRRPYWSQGADPAARQGTVGWVTLRILLKGAFSFLYFALGTSSVRMDLFTLCANIKFTCFRNILWNFISHKNRKETHLWS